MRSDTNDPGPDPREIQAVVFDYGGVMADEGFVNGLDAIARRQNLSPERVREAAPEAIHASGYIVGRAPESEFWSLFRGMTGVRGEDAELRREILGRFRLRPRMLALVRALRARGLRVAILSDQTDWLDTLEARDHFFANFDKVFNSYHMGKTKRDPSLFEDVSRELGVAPGRILFVDDKAAHVERARSRGFHGVVFTGEDRLFTEIARLLGSPLVASDRAPQSAGQGAVE
jgi:putative hydrolase of the HAD superfamily